MPSPSNTTAQETTLRVALRCCIQDPASDLLATQRAWLNTRLAKPEAFTAKEHAKLVPVLLHWSAGRTWEAALIEGLRDTVDAALLPEVEKPAGACAQSPGAN
jgi:hypothetical protein